MRVKETSERKPPEGRRERKRRESRERIAEAAIALFLERGFEATTIDEIAAAADVSKRTFFDYFPTKEDVVAAWQDRFGEALAAAVVARPADEDPAKAVEEALVDSLHVAADPRAFAIAKLIRETPVLRGRDQIKYARLEQRLAEALIERTRGKAEPIHARLLAMIVIGGMRIGGEAWHLEPPNQPLEPYARGVFRALWVELRKLMETTGR